MHSYSSPTRSTQRDDAFKPGHVKAVAEKDLPAVGKRSKAMGGLQTRFPRLSSSSAPPLSHTPQADGRGAQSRPSIDEGADGPNPPLHPSVARALDSINVNRKKAYQSLDRSLKTFLRASNLPGLEYRLKLAGYMTLDDLIDTDAEKLASEGFTRLMAKRLMTALDTYIKRHFDVTGGQLTPFQLVRRGHIGQTIQSDPTDEMKALPNFGKRNVRRSSSEQVPVGFVRRRRTNPRPRQAHSAVVRLMSEEQIPSEPIFPNVIDVRDSVFVEQGEESSGSEGGASGRSSVMTSATTSSSGSSQMIEIGRVVEIHQSTSVEGAGQGEGPMIIPIDTAQSSPSSAMFGEFYMDDVDTPSAAAPGEPDHTHQENDLDQQEVSDYTHQENDLDQQEVPDHTHQENDLDQQEVSGHTHQENDLDQQEVSDHTHQLNDSDQQEIVDDSNHTHQGGAANVIPLPASHPIIESAGYKLCPSASIPASYWFANNSDSSPPPQYPERTYVRIRAYSCPPSIVSMATPVEEDILTVLTSAQDVESIALALKHLTCQLESMAEEGEGEGVSEIEDGLVAAVLDVLETEKSNQRVAVLCCKVIKLMTREGMAPGISVPSGTVVAVLEAMNYHPTNERLQVEGCLALGNVGRTDPSYCANIVTNNGLQTVSSAMEQYSSSPQLQVVAMTALAVVLGAVKDARLLLVSDYGQVLDVVFQTMQLYPGAPQLQEYACALLALLVAEVGAQIESGVMQLIVEHVSVAMTTQPQNDHVTVWAAKVFSNAAGNAVFSDHKLAGHVAELLLGSMAAFPENVAAITWCSYALLQLSSAGGCGGVVSQVIKASQLPVYCQTPPPCLSDKARGYLKELEKLFMTSS